MCKRRIRLSFGGISGTLLGLAVAVTAAMGACSNKSAPAAEDIPVGCIAYVSDSVRYTGKFALRGVNLAVAKVNEAGGILVGKERRKIRLVPEDTKNEPEAAVAAAMNLINRQGVVALIGPAYSRTGIPVSRIAENAKIPMISPGATNREVTAGKNYVFRACFTDAFQMETVARFAVGDLGLRRIAVLYNEADVYSRGVAALFESAVKTAGAAVTFSSTFVTGDTDFRSQLAKIRSTAPDGLFLPSFSSDFIPQVMQLRETGYSGAILGSDAYSESPDRKGEASYLEGAYYVAHFYAGGESSGTREFVLAYKKAYGEEPEAIAALFYDAATLLFHAIAASGSTEPRRIAEPLRGVSDFLGATGTFARFVGGDPDKEAIIMQIRKGKDMPVTIPCPGERKTE